ncbi:translation initiation factor eIF-3b like protein [Dermatophagoides farinae]|uniref:Eukaryotic translation initiation factor 3 subunit B n=1 Tax=Dermatophagoides farinae TaxID=6954 RepID=A0A922HNU7_DERFA|nr:eukaryotic translation initiation factor 3 subunit B-like [Dermatophagoides farinae]KAH7644441.1 eukaryotic translation initiation factor 3 subunit b-like protein [Dermatophagoides farinae]KAH9493580.1 translation initiation factor eIF-3b like protein [Dermatophagoides farinae]
MAEGDLIQTDEGKKFQSNGTELDEQQQQQQSTQEPPTMPEEEPEPDFDDPEDFIDDIKDDELIGDILKNRPKQDFGLKSVIIVDGIPKVSPDRFEKLRTVLMRLFSKCGTILKDHFPLDENQLTKGYVFYEFENSEQAQEAVKTFNNHKLDKNHMFSVNMIQDIDKYLEIPDEFEEPEKKPYEDRGNLREWLLDPDCCDQFSVVYDGGDTTAIYLNSNPEPALIQKRTYWTEQSVHWSPLGTYMATFHKQGIALWGGPNFERLFKFAHEGVIFIDFSPCERFLVTLSQPLMLTNQENAIIIWDIRMQTIKRTFYAENVQSIAWPIFKWSHDDQYFGRIHNESLCIYETETFLLLDKKSMKMSGIKSFVWSPSENMLAYWVAEEQNVPARVSLIEIPSKNEVRSKNIFNVADCKMQWQNNGDYLCVKVDRYTKAKKERNDANKYTGLNYSFDLYHIREKQIPIDSIEIKEPIVNFGWEPHGSKLAIVHGDSPSYTISFYGIKQGTTVTLLKKFEKKLCNSLFWSPTGQFILLASLRSANYTLEFVDTSDFSRTNTQEHFKLSDVEWDPTGRYVVTSVSYWTNKSDNAYWVWSFQGRLLRKQILERLCQFSWRPQPPTLLSEEKIKEIRKNLKKYADEFDAKDRMAYSKLSKEMIDKRQQQLREYKEICERNRQIVDSHREELMQLREISEEQSQQEYYEEEYEFLVKEETVELD